MARISPRLRLCSAVHALMGVLLLVEPALAQEVEDQRRLEANPSAGFRHGGVGPPMPAASLPKHVPAPAGQLTFFADYSAADKDGVPLYLVNRTTSPVSWHSDGTFFIKLEQQRADGAWERAQAHLASTCGNSYYTSALQPGQYFQFHGYRARQGARARVRYASFLNPLLRSNEGEGLIDPGDLELVPADDMSYCGVPHRIVDLLTRSGPDARQKRKLSSQVAALRLLQTFTDHPRLRRDAQSLVDELAGAPAPGPESEQALAALRKILAGPWPQQTSTEALVRRCVAALERSGAPDAAEYGAPEAEPELVSSVLERVANFEFGLLGLPAERTVDLAVWMPLMTKIEAALKGKQEAPDRCAWHLLGVNHLVDEVISNEALELGVFHAEAFVSYACIRHLSRRMQWSRLADLGWALPPDRQLIVFIALACPPEGFQAYDGRHETRRPDDAEDDGEEKFWAYCLETQPLEAVWEVSRHGGPHYQFQIGDILRHHLRKFLRKEAKRSDQLGRDFDIGDDRNKMKLAVEILAAADEKKDEPIFKALLTHRGLLPMTLSRLEDGGVRDTLVQRYPLRQEACRALANMGVAIPQKVVLEKVIPEKPAPSKPPAR